MSYDLSLGFREIPKDLDSILAKMGFKFERSCTDSGLNSWLYRFYQEGKSLIPLDFSYMDSLEDKKFWHAIDPNIIAEATITARGDPGTFDFQKQMEYAKQLRDHYTAILVDIQEKSSIIKD